ncbi:response regulator transcription factor [Streptomyces tendae]|uniref:response regulator transcription factor n=1 Tax=Streptomyces tendae TaxID=1932 RepID=UPI0037F28FB6
MTTAPERPTPAAVDPVPSVRLTPRQLQVLHLAANGHPNKAIGRQLGTAEDTVKSQMAALMRRLHVEDRAHAVAVAIRLGLVSVDTVAIPQALTVVREDW